MVVLKTVQIVSTSDILGGKPRVEGRRIGVDQIAYHMVHQDWTLERMWDAYRLSPAEIHAALSYYYDHQDEIEGLILENLDEADDAPSIQDLIEALKTLLTTHQAAQRLRVTERAVRKLIESGTLPAKKVGANWFIHPNDLERDEVRNRRRPGRPPKNKS